MSDKYKLSAEYNEKVIIIMVDPSITLYFFFSRDDKWKTLATS